MDHDAGAGARTAEARLAQEFDAQRRRLVGLAYRMLGTVSDAEDVVQEAWFRLSRTERGAIENLPAWLSTVTSRLCLDRLRVLRASREVYVGPWLPEPLVDRLVDHGPGPSELAEADDSVRLALLVVLEALGPEQRVAFVLHDVFGLPFEQVAEVLGTTSANARQLASRARRTVKDADPQPVLPLAQQRAATEAFARAAALGDLDGLVRVLAPDVVLRSDGGGLVTAATRPVVGVDHVARMLVGLRGQVGPFEPEPVLVNGELAAVVRVLRPGATQPEVTVVVPHVGADGLIHGVDIQRNPEKLRGV